MRTYKNLVRAGKKIALCHGLCVSGGAHGPGMGKLGRFIGGIICG